jgi:protein N-terminal amidase
MSQCNIALVQYDPQFQQVKQNMEHVEKMIDHLTPELVDILLLPEMAFTGYMFSSLKEINPFLEDEVGPTITWAKKTAARLRCTILVGYPERAISGQAFNSVAIVDYNGQLQVRCTAPVALQMSFF